MVVLLVIVVFSCGLIVVGLIAIGYLCFLWILVFAFTAGECCMV